MKCTRCGKEKPVITLPYNGESLGLKCFTEFFERRVRKTIRTQKFLRYDDAVAVALSGGVSSSVLLYMLVRLASDKPKSRVFAVIVNDRGKGVKAAKKLCKSLDVEHIILRPDGVLLEEFLMKKIQELGATKIAFGVNLDDEADEALVRFFEGDLKTMKPRTYITPLRECPIEEIGAYARIKKIPVISESKKKKSEVYAKKIISKLEEKHPGTRFQILASKDCLMELFKKEC